MKKTLSSLFFVISSTTIIFSQINFNWDKVDSIPKTKTQIYTDTKIFISNQWNSAKDVIQSDDKEGGVIVVKGLSQKTISYAAATYNYAYSYIVKFMIKDGKVKIVIDNVHCQYMSLSGTEFPNSKIEPFDGDVCLDHQCGKPNSKFGNKVVNMMGELRIELQGIADNYLKTIKVSSGW